MWSPLATGMLNFSTSPSPSSTSPGATGLSSAGSWPQLPLSAPRNREAWRWGCSAIAIPWNPSLSVLCPAMPILKAIGLWSEKDLPCKSRCVQFLSVLAPDQGRGVYQALVSTTRESGLFLRWKASLFIYIHLYVSVKTLLIWPHGLWSSTGSPCWNIAALTEFSLVPRPHQYVRHVYHFQYNTSLVPRPLRLEGRGLGMRLV